ncbi:hypothetical protein HRbin23_01542 [bacterium HR23]|nr:hypothetical protein HRbin23_01542 [bacterium HR23]
MQFARSAPLATDKTQRPTAQRDDAPKTWNALRLNRLLQTFSRKELETLLDKGQRLRFSPETIVVHQGRPVEAVLFITQGKAAAVIEVPVSGSSDFGALVHFLGAGADIGLLSLVDGAPHSATVTALTDLEMVAIPVQALQQSLKAHPSRYRILAQVAVENLRTYQRAFRHGWERLESRQILC